jgi:hypothetical protein
VDADGDRRRPDAATGPEGGTPHRLEAQHNHGVVGCNGRLARKEAIVKNDLRPPDTAIELLRRGLWPVAIHPRGVEIRTKDGTRIAGGKVPIGTAWGVERPTEESLRTTYYANPGAGVGLRLGPEAGYIDIEADGPEGERSYEKIMGHGPRDALTLGWSSARGPHNLFKYDSRLEKYGKTVIKVPELPGLEIRIGGDGKQLQSCCPPTIGDDGQPRRWHDCDTIAELPEGLFVYLDGYLLARSQPAPLREAAGPQPQDSAFVAMADDGASPEARARAYVFSPRFPDSISGQHGHDAIYRCACELVDGFGLDRNRTMQILQEWNQAKARPPESEKQIAHKLDDAIKNHPQPSLKRLNAGRPARPSRNGPAAGTVVLPADRPIVLPEWPAPPGPAAYGSLAGEIVRTIEPESEADPVALLVQLLIGFGSVIGRGPHVRVGAARHYTNEFGVLVGETSAGRKGTSWSDARQFLAPADPDWHLGLGGLSSGEGLIYHVRDPIEGREPIRDRGKIVGYQDVIRDHGVSDKRLMIVETEFGAVLKALERDGNKLSAVIRQAWDGDTLASLTKGSPFRATGAQISIIGHITADELIRLLTACDQANGFANRMLWVCCKRSKLLPYGGRLAQQDADRLRARVADVIAFARGIDAVGWTRGAMDLWEAAYPRLTAARPGVFGMVTSRAEAHAVRLALLYALLDRSAEIKPDHLQAALELWDYSERSARYIFGDALGDKDAQTILDALRAAPAGLTRTEINRDVLKGHRTADTIASKLSLLLQRGLVRCETTDTEGRSAERWFAVANRERSERSAESQPAPVPSCASFASSALRSEDGAAPGREVFEL